MRREHRWVPVVVFTLAVFALLPLPLLGMRTYAAVDMLETGAPYRNAIGRPPHVASPIQTDQVEGFPGVVDFFRAARHGRFQRATFEIAGGTPTGLFPFNGLLSPFSAGYLALPAWYAIGLRIALAFVFCQCFTYLFLRRLGVTVVAATLGAVAYTFSGVNLVFIHRVSAQLVLPALLWAVDRLIDRATARRAAVAALLVAWTWFEGFPAGFAYCVYLAGAWAAWRVGQRWWRERPHSNRLAVRTVALLGVALAWGVAIASVNLLPFVVEVTQRGVLTARNFGADSHLPRVQYFGLFDTRALGTYPSGSFWTGNNPVEGVTHVGLLVTAAVAVALLLALAGRLRLTDRGREAWTFFLLVGSVGVIATFIGTPLLAVLLKLPGIANNPFSRARFFIPLATAVVTALAVDSVWHTHGERTRRPAPRLLAGLVLLGGVALTAWLLPQYVRAARAAGDLRAVAEHVLVGALVIPVAAVVVVVAARRPRWRVPAGLFLAALVFVPLTQPLRDFTPASPVRDFYRPEQGHRDLERLLDGRYRFTASGLNTFYPNSSQLFRLSDLRGVALRSQPAKDLMEAVSPQAFARDPLKVVLGSNEWNLASPVLDHLAVRFFAMGTDEMPLGRVTAQDGRWDSWARPALIADEPLRATQPVTGLVLPLRGVGTCDRARVHLELRAGGRTLDVATRPAYDARGDWTAFAVDGESLRPGDEYTVQVRTEGAGCRVEVGVIGSGADARPARQEIGPDPSVPVKLRATGQAWIYERPAAWSLVSAHTRWRRFPDRARAIAWTAGRPPAERDVAAVVGPGPVAGPGGAAPALSGVQWSDSGVQLHVRGAGASLVAVSLFADRGWEAQVDGRQVSLTRVDGTLLGVVVPAGRHRVSFSYDPGHADLSVAITMVALALAGVALAWPALSRRRRPPSSAPPTVL